MKLYCNKVEEDVEYKGYVLKSIDNDFIRVYDPNNELVGEYPTDEEAIEYIDSIISASIVVAADEEVIEDDSPTFDDLLSEIKDDYSFLLEGLEYLNRHGKESLAMQLCKQGNLAMSEVIISLADEIQ